ncbi:hypothetical protein R3P38DRAFT_3213786 [Favolaschia claudopus]|uniref:Uncharacterized protein n=1 Tax=Favolaschia claudopus TaxID=2862362 RepID=A0AAW0AE92_9AGAR
MLIDLSREGWDIEFLKAVRTAANDALTRVGEPAGITATYADMLVHPPGLPWNDSALNATQNRGTLLNAIPVRLAAGEVGMVNHSSISSPDSQPTASTSRDRGRGKPRGGAVGRGRGNYPSRGRGMYGGSYTPDHRVYQHNPASTPFASPSVTHSYHHPAPPPYHSSPHSQQQYPLPAGWHNYSPYFATTGPVSQPASSALQQQHNTANLFAPYHSAPATNPLPVTASSDALTAAADALNMPIDNMSLDSAVHHYTTALYSYP